MFFCLRVDLDYVPWDTPDATEFGHGEPAMTLRLMEMARDGGYRLQFFASTRSLRAFPCSASAILDEGHDLDWLCKYPSAPQSRYAEARKVLINQGQSLQGLAVREQWPTDASAPGPEFKFVSATGGSVPTTMRFFSASLRSDRQAARAGLSARRWADEAKQQIREAASRNVQATLCVRPQVLARFDPKLSFARELVDFAQAVGLRVMSLRQAMETMER